MSWWNEWRGDFDGNVTMLIKHLLHWRGYKVDLHKMIAPDRYGCFHSHPAKAIRVVFWGGYVEEIYQRGFVCWLPLDFGIVRPQMIHRIDALVNEKCSYSLWIRWPKSHEIELHGDGWDGHSPDTQKGGA